MRLKPLILILLLLLSATWAHAAVKGDPVEQAGATVETPYFKVTIPTGWMMPHPVKKQPMDGISTVFATTSGNLALTINIMKVAMDARTLAEQTATNMQKSGLKTTKPIEKGRMWKINIEGAANGQAWFGSDGKLCSVITLFGTDFPQANGFIKNVRTGLKNLLPQDIR